MANYFKPTQPNIMKKLFFTALILITTFSFAKDFEIVSKPGILLSSRNPIALYCNGITYEPCAFNIALEDGVYLYISKTFTDTATVIVSNDSMYELGEQKDKKLIPIIY